MKQINFSLGGGFIYQWWVGAFIKYTIDTYDNTDEADTKVYSKSIKEILKKSFDNSVFFQGDDFFSESYGSLNTDNIDILLEGKGDCFEDINLLYKNGDRQTTILFFQVKGGNEILLRDGKEKKEGVLSGKNRREHLFSNFLNNKNIYNISDQSKFIVISNKHVDNNIINISMGTDRTLIINKVISEIRKNYKIKVAGRSIKKLEKLIEDIYKGVEIKRKMYGATLPFKNEKEQEEVILFTQNTVGIIKRTIILENFNISTIIGKLYEELGESSADKIFKGIYQKSIDISTIKSSDDDFTKYLKYNDVLFMEGQKISDISEIREGKFL